MRPDRVVLDTNVLISAALQSKGPPRAVLDSIGRIDGTLLFSDQTFEELRTRLMRPKFERYVSVAARGAYVSQLRAVAEWVSITESALGCRDPEDDKFLETALLGQADCLVTGDQDLLVMSPFRQISILRPAAFLESMADTPT